MPLHDLLAELGGPLRSKGQHWAVTEMNCTANYTQTQQPACKRSYVVRTNFIPTHDAIR